MKRRTENLRQKLSIATGGMPLKECFRSGGSPTLNVSPKIWSSVVCEYLIRLPWPNRELFPNFKRSHHWRTYRHLEKSYRETCWKLTLVQTGASPSGIPNPLPMSITFHPPDRRKRDDDGIIGAFKNGRDGIADALGVDDAIFKPTYEIGDVVRGGCVMVHVCAKDTADVPIVGQVIGDRVVK
jgi:crossover junction endodeoxyribonuclease RusA